VPKLAKKVVEWLDAKPDEKILDVGCGGESFPPFLCNVFHRFSFTRGLPGPRRSNVTADFGDITSCKDLYLPFLFLEWKRSHTSLAYLDSDGILTLQIAKELTTGSIHGVDSSVDMIRAAKQDATAATIGTKCTYEVCDANHLILKRELQIGKFDKVLSNAAMHWILGDAPHRQDFFRGVFNALKPNGLFVFEMGGMGNVAEMRTALLGAVGRRIGMDKAREVDPWFFPDEQWMKQTLEGGNGGFKVERSELEYRPTRMEEGDGGGIEGWIRLMGKQFFDAIGGSSEQREECVMEVVENLRTVCGSPSGGEFIGYVRLRVSARKVR